MIWLIAKRDQKSRAILLHAQIGLNFCMAGRKKRRENIV
jgi:hypothetical protein